MSRQFFSLSSRSLLVRGSSLSLCLSHSAVFSFYFYFILYVMRYFHWPQSAPKIHQSFWTYSDIITGSVGRILSQFLRSLLPGAYELKFECGGRSRRIFFHCRDEAPAYKFPGGRSPPLPTWLVRQWIWQLIFITL